VSEKVRVFVVVTRDSGTSFVDVVVGKPSAAMFDIVLRDLEAGRGRTAMVGDSLESDIAGAHRAGIAGEDRQSSFTQAPPALEANVRDLGCLFDSAAAPVRWSRSAARNTIGGEL
jgi:FMN phosphatase YigB (HAD superfamily)